MLILIVAEECSIDQQLRTDACENTTCSWTYSSVNEMVNGACVAEDGGNILKLSLSSETQMNETFEVESRDEPRIVFAQPVNFALSISFRCYLNNCNNRLAGESVKEAVYKRYRFWVKNISSLLQTTTDLTVETTCSDQCDDATVPIAETTAINSLEVTTKARLLSGNNNPMRTNATTAISQTTKSMESTSTSFERVTELSTIKTRNMDLPVDVPSMTMIVASIACSSVLHRSHHLPLLD